MTFTLITMAVLAGAPVIEKGHKLDCPTGTTQFGGPGTKVALLSCVEGQSDGMRVYHGPYISFYASGAVEAVGQTSHGMRDGTWRFFDEKGVLAGETQFKAGDFDGYRVFFHPNGKLKTEQHWAAGKQVGSEKTFDLNGRLIGMTEYKDGRALATAR